MSDILCRRIAVVEADTPSGCTPALISPALGVLQAALCCIRILRHLPEHVEDFMERIMDVLKDRHHGVLVAGVQLITAVVASDPKVREACHMS